MKRAQQTYEIEIKSLLGQKKNADAFRKKLLKFFPHAQLVEESKQLNHYFLSPDVTQLVERIRPYIPTKQRDWFAHVLRHGKKISVRTRQLNKKVLFILKAAIDDTTSSNGISRIEFEIETPKLSLQQLDDLLLASGLRYQAKWSREREAYRVDDMTISIDKNAGYGFLAEFEQLVHNEAEADQAKMQLRHIMAELGAQELDQARLERMFAHYNAHWPEYYGTNKTFVIQ